MKKIILSSLLCMVFVFSVYPEEITKIIAKVNNQVITAKDLEDYYKVITYKMPDVANSLSKDEQKGKKEALEKLIEDKLILEEAKKQKLEAMPHLVNNQLNKIIESYPTRQEFENSLIERGLNITILKERISGQFMMRQIIDNNVSGYISVSPQEIGNYYQQNKDKIKSPEKYAIWVSQNKDKNLIVAIAQKIKEGGIAAAEKEYPDNFFKLEASMTELKEEIAEAVKKLKPGEHVIRSVDQMHYLIYFEKILPSAPLSLEEAQENIYNIIWNEKFKQRFNEWVKQLKEKAFIKIYL